MQILCSLNPHAADTPPPSPTPSGPGRHNNSGTDLIHETQYPVFGSHAMHDPFNIHASRAEADELLAHACAHAFPWSAENTAIGSIINLL